MARNRKYQSGSVRFVPALKAILLCVFFGGSAVGYVIQKNQIYELGRQMRDKEVQHDRLVWENQLRANQLAELQSPTKIAERLRQHNLDLVMPQPSQIVWLRDTPAEPSNNTLAQSFKQ